MIQKSRNQPSPYGHHRHPVGHVLTTKYRKSIGSPLRRRELAQPDRATGVDAKRSVTTVSIRNSESGIYDFDRNRCRTGASAAEGAGSLPMWLAGSTCKDMARTPLWGLMQCRIEQVLAFELGRVARLFAPHRLQAR